MEATDADWRFTDAEMLTAVGHLENYGYVKRLRTSKGEQRVLLQPERLNNLASSFVLEARRNPKGLGALEEKRLLAGGYDFPELKDLHKGERDVLLDSAALLFLEHNVCFRETDPLRMEPYLVFPELINLKKPPEEEQATEDGVAYTVSGPTENVFASLVVLLGYTHTFTRTNQWQNNARYEVGDGLVCGFRQEAERDGELDFVLCFGPKVGPPVRTLFQGLFESFLARRNLTVMRYEPVRCSNATCGHLLDRSVVRQRMKEGKTFAFCNECGEKLTLPKMAEPIQLTREVQAEVDSQRRSAEQRTRFEQAVFRVRAYVAEQKITAAGVFRQLRLGRARARTLGRESGWRRTCRRRGSTWCWTSGTTPHRRERAAFRGADRGVRAMSSWSGRPYTDKKRRTWHQPRAAWSRQNGTSPESVCLRPRHRSRRCCLSCSRVRIPSLSRPSCAAGFTATSATRGPTSRWLSI